jgi:hypothetical protein
MKRQLIAGAAAIALGVGIVDAQTAQRQGEPVARAAAANQVTLVGCVEFEQDYRKRLASGRGGALGTGAGASDEFVLTNVRPASAVVGTAGSRPGNAPAGAAGQNSANVGPGGGVYALTGPQEKNLKRDVGRQVEVVGVIENAGKPDTGAELKDVSDLPRIDIKTWHTVQDFCPAK